VQRRETGVRVLIRFSAILLSIWTILVAFLGWVFDSMDQAFGTESLSDTLKIFAILAVGWILVIVAWVKTEQPWRNRYVSTYEEDGVWLGSIYLPNRADKD
jgi:hypothetical protein